MGPSEAQQGVAAAGRGEVERNEWTPGRWTRRTDSRAAAMTLSTEASSAPAPWARSALTRIMSSCDAEGERESGETGRRR